MNSDQNFIEVAKQFNEVIVPGRYRDVGQLRYAMRSAYMHAPFIRKLFVVVNNKDTQIPSWLDANHPRVQVVEHASIWDNEDDLPSMNSHAIEWATMNIPNISSLYLLFNDDFSIMKPLNLSSIWTDPNEFILHQAWHTPSMAHVKNGGVKDPYGKSIGLCRQLI